MSFVIIGEAATKVMERYPDFVAAQTEVPWRAMRGMRNRIAHGYFEINLELVWDTVQIALPQLLKALSGVAFESRPASSESDQNNGAVGN